MSFTDEELGLIEGSLTSKRPGLYWAGKHARALIQEMMNLHAQLGGDLPFDGQIGQLKSNINKDTHPFFVTKTAPTIIRFIREKRAEAKAKAGKRARAGGGKFKSDDPSTPNVNEAYADGKTPAKKTQRKTSSKKTSSATTSKAKPKAAPKTKATKAKAKTKK
tara:strand:+ start:343 stop:831 length:489 start_codon:yes stop_codon:yes gene_type:complete